MKKAIYIALLGIMLLSLSIPSFAANSAFDEARYKGSIITYTDDGTPIVDDPNATIDSLMEANASVASVYATTNCDTMMYYDYRKNQSNFIIPKGKTVLVVESIPSYSMTKVTYSSTTGYVSTADLTLK